MHSLQRYVYITYAVTVCLMFMMLVIDISAGHSVVVMIWSLIVSPGIFLSAVFAEGRMPRLVLSFKNQSWAFLFGDPLCIAPALAVSAMAWRDLPYGESHFYNQLWWVIVSGFLGVMFGLAFYVIDGGKYRKAGVPEALKSPSKICHDLVVYPVLSGALIYGSVPLLFERSWHTWVVISLVVAWLLLAACDGIRNPDPRWLHPRWDPRNFCIIPEASLK